MCLALQGQHHLRSGTQGGQGQRGKEKHGMSQPWSDTAYDAT